MKNRECPYCHRKIALKRCLRYFYRGTNYATTCNHCGKEIRLTKEPVPFMYCFCAGILSAYVPSYFFLYRLHWPFLKAVLYDLPFLFLCTTACTILTFKRLFFKRTD
ncbi:hypothetical protein HMPREF9944_01421 [Segatella maculosa OT 289]|uniref:Cxxc_20_cxxc protein n=1 Tax=Segatella maculosa OT 289 TaxID=999422 RepID=H1HMM7_9BACT|nr:hypothetical protein HMPREF9944_01421 [Segatella maculosa OT 289]